MVENGFGTNWLGCLVEALGGKWENTYCRGSWMSLQCQGNVLRMETETAWAPCIETYDFICEKFPSLTYYYISEEPMMDFYETNDSEGRYFKDRYAVDAHFPDDGYVTEYFPAWRKPLTGCRECAVAPSAPKRTWATSTDSGNRQGRTITATCTNTMWCDEPQGQLMGSPADFP